MSNLDKVSKREAITRLWEIGKIFFKLDSTQRELYDTFHNAVNKTIVWACSRRLGKSYALCVLAIEQCLTKPNSIVKYVAPQQKMVKTIIRPIMRELIEDAPARLKPKYFTQDNIWRFPNGSEIQLSGTDNGNAENLRGSNADLCIVDEAGFCQDLEYLVNSILLPTMLTTNGKIILSSTPPLSSDHPFVEYMKDAQLKGSFIIKTIYDNPRISREQADAFIEESGGIESNTVQRELFCKILTDTERAVVPEFTEELAKEIVKVWPRPSYYHAYTAMDIAHKDLTVVLFAYHDFRNDKLIFEDEYVINGPEMTTDKLADEIKKKEKVLWKDPFGPSSFDPYLRVADNNLIMINDLQRLHNLSFIATAKDDADAAMNHMRMLIGSKKVIINPKCVTLIEHLRNATWNKQRKSFERGVDHLRRQHHYDAVDAAKYMIRNVFWNKNPFPLGYDVPKGDLFMTKEAMENLNPFERSIRDIFTVKPGVRRKSY